MYSYSFLFVQGCKLMKHDEQPPLGKVKPSKRQANRCYWANCCPCDLRPDVVKIEDVWIVVLRRMLKKAGPHVSLYDNGGMVLRVSSWSHQLQRHYQDLPQGIGAGVKADERVRD